MSSLGLVIESATLPVRVSASAGESAREPRAEKAGCLSPRPRASLENARRPALSFGSSFPGEICIASEYASRSGPAASGSPFTRDENNCSAVFISFYFLLEFIFAVCLSRGYGVAFCCSVSENVDVIMVADVADILVSLSAAS